MPIEDEESARGGDTPPPVSPKSETRTGLEVGRKRDSNVPTSVLAVGAGVRQPETRRTRRPLAGAAHGFDTSVITGPGTTLAERIGMPTLKTPVALLSLPGERPFDTQASTRTGKYLLGELLGEGGMGSVIAAREVDMGRTVALKTLRDEHQAEEGFVEALVFEARLMGQLQHPNIVPVYELGAMPDGKAFYTMKLVGDLSLKDVLRQLRDGNDFAVRTYTLPRLLQYFRGICMGVEYAHARGVVHRDLKPDNILIGDYGEVQIMDWGVARVMPREGRPSYFAGRVEEPGAIIGTPHYMSPEQARGDTHLVDPRSDVYSLGIILYQLLTYTLPYDATTTAQQLDALLCREVPPPSARAPQREIPHELERVCLRALARRRDDRYPSARALWNDIESFLEGRREQERLAELAEAQVVVAMAAANRYKHLSEELLTLEEAVRADELSSRPLDPLVKRKAAWQRRLAAEHRRLVEADAFAEAVDGFNQVLAYQPAHREARRQLASLYISRGQLQRKRGDDAGFVLYSGLAEALLGPSREAATGSLDVRSYPEGARIRVYRLEGQTALTPDDALDLRTAPVRGVALTPGTYLVSATLPGHRECRHPVVITANEETQLLLAPTPWSASEPLVARGDELSAIKEHFSACVAMGRLGSMMVTGGPGLGKSKLLATFQDYLDALPQDVAYGSVQADPLYKHVPFLTIAEFLGHRAGIRRHDSVAVIKDKLHAAVERAFTGQGARPLSAEERADVDRITARIACIPNLCGRTSNDRADDAAMDAPSFAHAVLEAFADYVAQLLEDTPVVLAIRGAENLDRLSRDALFFLADRLADAPLFCLMFSREDELQLRCDQVLSLRPLDGNQVDHQLTMLLRGPVDQALVDVISERSGGNPFYVSELTRMMIERGWIAMDQRRWGLTPLGITAIVEDLDIDTLLRMALQELPDHSLAVLRAASIAGTTFWAEHIARVTSDDVDTPDALADLVDREIIVARPSSRFVDTAEYSFRHDSMQALLYGDLDDATRREGHRQLAAWLAEQPSVHLSDLALRAHHLTLGKDPEGAAPLLQRLADEAAGWERDDAPPWFDWPANLVSGLFDGLM